MRNLLIIPLLFSISAFYEVINLEGGKYIEFLLEKQYIMNLAAEETINVDVRTIAVAELQQADEVFVCNSLIGIWPVRRVDDSSYEKGPLTTYLQTCQVRSHDDSIT